jgi:hypothetical protein
MSKYSGGSFQAIQEYFQRQTCRFCLLPYTPEGIQLLREEPGMLVVKVGCSNCGKPLGVAIVGTNGRVAQSPHPGDWTKRDAQRLSRMPAITYDDVLAAHQFLEDAGAEWSKHLCRLKRRPAS